MNKIFVRVVLLSVAFCLVLLFLFRSRSPFGKNNSSFASEPEREITRIELSDGKQGISLEKHEEKWLIDGKFESRKSGILFILKILQEIKIKSPVSDELFKSEITDKEIDPVRVRVFENRKLLKSFLVYKTRSNKYGNIMKVKKNSKPFIVYIPGYESNIGSVFSLNELFWKPYTVFNLLPSEIESVDFENMADTSSSFLIVIKNQHYSLSDRNRELSGWDSTSVGRYLSYFTWIPFESWAFETGEQDKNPVESQQPQYRITVNTRKGISTVLTLWEKVAGEGDSKKIDSDRLLGKTQDRDELFIMRYFDIDPLLKKRSYFFRE
jgi:hypothetical protein